MGNRTVGGGGDGVFGVVCTREAYRLFLLAQTVIRQYSVVAIFLAKCSPRHPPVTQIEWRNGRYRLGQKFLKRVVIDKELISN